MAQITIDRDYIDNYSVKEFAKDKLMDTYFSDIDVNLRNVGMFGYTTELITNISEDTFNTGSVLFRESFPNRAQLDESIYSHAAIFQLDDVLSCASSCKFLLVLEEEAIIKNMEVNKDKNNKNMFHFFIDKNTTIYIEDIPFTLDYDIMMTIVRKVTEKGDDYLFSARYITEEYKNSLSDVQDPYVKVRRSSDGYIALEVRTHQCTRDVREEKIITNNEINYPVIDLEYEGKLAGFEVLYKAPETEKYIQMQTLIVYSQALRNPFCYYQMIDEGKLRISFNTKDTYFMPEFNSDLKIILYMTEGEKGQFESYEGTNISLLPNNDTYTYANSYLTAARPVGAAEGGRDAQGIEALQALAVEGYRTALALTTDSDLQEFFNNYKYRYGNADILFIKKRDDVYERVFSAFMIIRNNDFIFKTNTLNLAINLYDLVNNERDIFILEPGTVFTCNTTSGYAEYYRDTEKNKKYYDMYLKDLKAGKTPYITEGEVDPEDIPDYLNRPCSFAQWKARKGYSDTRDVWSLTDDDYQKNDDPSSSKFLIMNPFLVKFTKSPNLVSTYMTYVNNEVAVDFTDTNNDMYLQFVIYTFYLQRKFIKEKRYDAWCKVASTMTVDNRLHPLIHVDGYDDNGNNIYHLNDPYALDQNDLRVFMCVMQGQSMLCYTEMIPTEYDAMYDNFTFKSTLFTDDHITSTGKLRLLSGRIYRNPKTGNYYKVHKDDNTLYGYYDKDGKLLEDNVSVNDVTAMVKNKEIVKHDNIVNTYVYDDVLVPIDEVNIRIYTLYKKNYSETQQGLVDNLSSATNNPFMEYGDYDKYIWTNEYSTLADPVVFMKSMESIRTYLDFEDYTEAKEEKDGTITFPHDIMDIDMKSISYIRANTIKEEENIDYFFNVFYNHYKFLEDIIDTRLRNETGLDIKFYNTYGRSKNFIIGEGLEVLDTVNLRLSFDMWFVDGTDLVNAIPEVKRYIKEEVETINEKGMNNLFISNLMRKIEQKFAYVDHIRFRQINYYDSTYQAVKNYVTDLDDLTVEERRWYVPELLVCDLDDIDITEYIAT